MPSSKNSFAAPALGLLLMVAATGVVAQEKNWSITLGLKAWLNQWETWTGTTAGGVVSDTSKTKLSPIPSASFKYRDFFVSSSYFAKTNYKFPVPAGGEFEADRREFDLNFGWYFVPRLAGTVGFKRVDQDFTFGPGPVDKWRYTAPIVGIVGSAPVSDRLLLYGGGAWGPKVTTKQNGTKQSNLSGSYNASEFGLAWLIARNFAMTLGYKYQIIQNEIEGSNSTLLRDVTDGWAIGGQVTF